MESLLAELSRISDYGTYGRVAGVQGLLVEVAGLFGTVSVGTRVNLNGRRGSTVPGEVVGFRNGRALVMPFGSLDGIGLGAKAWVAAQDAVTYPHATWLGRVLNALGEPIDGEAPLAQGPQGYALRAAAPVAAKRKRLGKKIDLGVRSINTFTTVCLGQRMGIFAGSGIGKSVLLSMMAKYASSERARHDLPKRGR